MISFPEPLLSQFDALARERGTTRSGLLQELARREVEASERHRRALDARRQYVAGASNWGSGFDAVEAIRRERRSH